MMGCSRANRARGITCVSFLLVVCNTHAANAACPADIAPPGGNGTVNVDDLLAVITNWGPCPAPCPPHCSADIAPAGSPAGNCTVNVDDLLAVITSWGACPCNPTGTWVNSAAINYFCAFGSVDLNISQWTFSQAGSVLHVLASGLPGPMNGAAVNCGAGQSFSVTVTAPGSCTETYTLAGTFTSANQFTGTFTMAFTPSMAGACFDCTTHVANVTATRSP